MFLLGTVIRSIKVDILKGEIMSKLKKVYKHITIKSFSKYEGKPIYYVIHNKSSYPIGLIYWCSVWKRFVSGFESGAVFSANCLHDITDFMEKEI